MSEQQEQKYNWQVFRGDRTQDGDRIKQLPPPPPWRQFRAQPRTDNEEAKQKAAAYQQQIDTYWQQLQTLAETDDSMRDRRRGKNFCIRSDRTRVVQAVNAALTLRRPLLITGRPGSGKTSLAYAIAYELKLGPVLMWPITARSTLEAGLYRYDAIARLQDAQLRQQNTQSAQRQAGNTAQFQEGDTPQLQKNSHTERNIGDYIQLGPLGTAFLPTPYPRVLLIDEIDKSDINLPNDLLNLLEEGQFEIAELVRLSDAQERDQQMSDKQAQDQPDRDPDPIKIRTADDLRVSIERGKLRCDAFPLIVMTSNGERDFPPAFLRRCLRIEMPNPGETDLYNIVEAHLTPTVAAQVNDLVKRFAAMTDSQAAMLATDQLLNAVYLRQHGAAVQADDELEQLILAALTSGGGSG